MTGRQKSQYVCERCGLAVYTWGGKGAWKHAGGGHAVSCGRPAKVVRREDYEAEMDAIADSVRHALRRK